MKVSLSWLKEYIPIDLEPDDIAARLTMAGLEVDAVERLYGYLDTVVVARVVEVRKHPNADKLSCCTVDSGGGELVQIVCGAPNVHENMTVACALPGSVLPGDLKIKKSKLRGEVSCGMLCSGKELRLDDDSSGILDLETSAPAGTPLMEALAVSDTAFEIDLTPNRPDCLSLIGTAREIGAFELPGHKVTKPDVSLPSERMGKDSIHDFAKVDIEDPDLCPRYSAGFLFDVKIGPSPFWLQQRLESVGLTPISNVVDVTNFVMLETGQPLHAFDYDDLSQGRIVVKRAGAPIEFTTLDSKIHKLEPEMLMICDGDRPVALAGVMGGENSEITDATSRVLIESAYFNPVSVRRTAKRTNIATDASHRFERGIDPEGTVFALKRAMCLIAELCDATIADGIIDEYPQKVKPVRIDLDTAALNTRLGTQFQTEDIAGILASVEFGTKQTGAHRLSVDVPSFRVDVTRPEDLSEEVARLWGYNRIETSFPPVPAKGRPLSPVILTRAKVRGIMSGFGFSEAINYNFIAEDFCDKLGLVQDDHRRSVVKILNPLSDQMAVLRSTMVPGLLDAMRRNTAQQTETVHLFEIGKIFFANPAGDLPEEREVVAGLLTGNRTDQTWYSKKVPVDFYDLKGVVEGLLSELRVTTVRYEKMPVAKCPYFEAGHAARIISGERVLGSFGKVDQQVLKGFALKQDAYLFELDLAGVMTRMPEQIQARPLPKFPSIARDITLIVNKTAEVGGVLDALEAATERENLVEDRFLFDMFEGEPLAKGKKSLSFRIVYRSSTKTLTEKSIHKLHAKISENLIKSVGADLPE